jgi:hypothetical protein
MAARTVIVDDAKARSVLADPALRALIPELGKLTARTESKVKGCPPCQRRKMEMASTASAKQVIANLSGDRLEAVKKFLGAERLRIVYPAPAGKSADMTI